MVTLRSSMYILVATPRTIMCVMYEDDDIRAEVTLLTLLTLLTLYQDDGICRDRNVRDWHKLDYINLNILKIPDLTHYLLFCVSFGSNLPSLLFLQFRCIITLGIIIQVLKT